MKTRFTLMLMLMFLLLIQEAPGAQYSTGLKVPKDWRIHARFSTNILGVNLPAHFDWREHVKVSPKVKNQGQCGSCWAHATSEVEEWLIDIADKKVEVLSPQELVSCDTSSQGCSGGYFDAFEYEKQIGLTYEKDFPYKAEDTRCDVSGLPHDYRIFDWGYVGSAASAPSVEQIKAQVVAGGPIAVGVCADDQFMNYKSGVFNGGNCQSLNHMTVIVGFDEPSQSWIMQNSWGVSWGEKGFMRIKYGANAIAQIAAFAVYKH